MGSIHIKDSQELLCQIIEATRFGLRIFNETKLVWTLVKECMIFYQQSYNVTKVKIIQPTKKRANYLEAWSNKEYQDYSNIVMEILEFEAGEQNLLLKHAKYHNRLHRLT